MLENKDYCDYETCVALKELGYKGMSRYYYTHRDHKLHYDTYNKFYTVRTADAMGYVLAIHLYEAQKWLREEKNIDISVTISPFEYFATIREFVFWRGEYSWKTPPIYPNGAKTYEEALFEGIKEAVKILKER